MNGRTADTCIFCKIAQKKIDAKIIDENENAIAFLDAFPLTCWSHSGYYKKTLCKVTRS